MNMEITIFIIAIVVGILVNLLTGYLYEPFKSWTRQLEARVRLRHRDHDVIKIAIDDYLKFLSKYKRVAWLNFSGKDDGILNQSISEFYFPI